MSLSIVVNSIIEWFMETQDSKPYLERVLWIDRFNEHVVVLSISSPTSLPILKTIAEINAAISSGSCFQRPIDPFAHLSNPSQAFLEKHRDKMDRAWEIINEIVIQEPEIYLREHRGKLIRFASMKSKANPREIYKYLRRYWLGGKTKYALLPVYNNCGGPGKERIIKNPVEEQPKRGRPPKIRLVEPDHTGLNVNEEIKKIFKISTNLYYNNRDQNPLRRAYNKMVDNHFNMGYRVEGGVAVPIILPANQIPTFGQFSYWNRKNRRLIQSVIAREGARQYKLRSRALLGNSTQMAFGPGSIFQVDATIGDVYLVSSLNRNWIIGRPVIYFVVDVFSRMVVGLYVGLEGPSWVGAMMAIANATSSKISFCAEYGIEICQEIWPSKFLSESVLADRGEFFGLNSDRLPDSLDVPLANCPAYRADLKGIVEQMFRRVNLKTIHWLPGAVRGRERGEADHRLDATLDLRQFTKIIILTVLDYNLYHRVKDYPMDLDMIRDEVEPVPIELWNWGLANRVGHLREKSQEIIRLSLMPMDMATVTPQGLKFKGLYYSTERALHEEWYVRARREGTWTVPVSYDPRRLDILYLRIGGSEVFEVCNLLEKDARFKALMLEEMLDYFAIEDFRAQQQDERRMQSGAELRAKITAVEAEAAKLKKAEGIGHDSANKQIQGIRKHRAEEKADNRKSESFDLRSRRDSNAPGSVHPLRPETDQAEENGNATSSYRRKQLLSILKENVEEE